MATNKSNVKRVSRFAQMKTQEEIIQRKKQEILEKQRNAEIVKQIASAAATVESSSSSVGQQQSSSQPQKQQQQQQTSSDATTYTTVPKNSFLNDGSFLENFKKLSEQVQQKMQAAAAIASPPEATVSPPPTSKEEPAVVVNQELSTVPRPTQLVLSPPPLPPATIYSAAGQMPPFQVFHASPIMQQTSPPMHVVELTTIPPPKNLDLSAIPQPILQLDQIKMPELDIRNVKDDHDIPTTIGKLVELVAEIGDLYEDKLCLMKNDLPTALRFLLDRDSEQYRKYRVAVESRRVEKQSAAAHEQDKYDPAAIYEEDMVLVRDDEEDDDDEPEPPPAPPVPELRIPSPPALAAPAKPMFASIDRSDSSDSDTEYMRETKQRNTVNLKRKAEDSAVVASIRQSQLGDSTDSEEEECAAAAAAMGANASGGEKKRESSGSEQAARAKKKKSRWGEQVQLPPAAVVAVPPAVQLPLLQQQTPMLTKVTRSDPALVQYAIMNYGSAQLTEEDWKKAEEHYKINLLYQDMLRKRQEIDRLAKTGKFKYEYDSDEDTTGGTWEHKLRTAEMEATQRWAEALTKQSEGKHHIGDFLPPEELKKFMEKFDAKKTNKAPDLSDYKEYKLTEDNVGFQLLQKLGWKEGQGLGADGSGIVDPVNKAAQRGEKQGLGVAQADQIDEDDDEFDAYRKRMMLAYRFRPNPLNNPRRAYY